ncbi:hypothetical protein ABPG74_019335 [Tetrahymena malaccensis]
MTENCSFGNKNTPLGQRKSSKEHTQSSQEKIGSKNFDIMYKSDQNNTLQKMKISSNTQNLQHFPQNPDLIQSRIDGDQQVKFQLQNRYIDVNSNKSLNVIGDQNAGIQEDDTKETINSINSLKVKRFSQNLETFDKNTQINITLSNFIQHQTICRASNCLTSESPIQKYQESDSNQKQNGFFLEIPLNQSQNFIDDNDSERVEEYEDGDENQSDLQNLTNQKSEKSTTSSLKTSQIKRVTFQDLSQINSLKSPDLSQTNEENASQQQFFFHQRQKSKLKKAESLYQFSEDNLKRTSKSILKRSQTFELNQQQRDVKDLIQTYSQDMDFCDILQEQLIQQLLESESCNTNYLKKYFFSELATKISSSGEKKKKIIFLTHNQFYVLQDLQSNQHIQKFNISEINKITIHSDYQDVCSIIVKNQFQLNLQIKHFKEFINFIQTIFKCVLKSFLPIIQKKQKLKINQEPQQVDNNNTEQKMQLFLNSQKKEFYIQIMIISNNIIKYDSKILGLLQFFQNKEIYITGFEQCQELNRLTQVVLLNKDIKQKIFIFQNTRNPELIFHIQLLADKDFPHFMKIIQNINNYNIK